MRLFSDKDRMLKDSLVLFGASIVGNGLNFLFQAAMGRMLPPEEFAALWALLAAFLILSVPANAIQTSILRYTAQFHADNEPTRVQHMMFRALRRLLFVAIPLVGGCLLASRPLADFLQLKSSLPVVITGLILAVSVFQPVLGGVLQGFQRFGWMSVIGVVGGVVRVAAGIVLVAAGMKAAGGLAGTLVANLAMLGLTFWILRSVVRASPPPGEVRLDSSEIYRYLWPVLLGTACITLLMQLDLVAAKRLLEPSAAGTYVQAATVARLVLYVAGPITMAMFPKIVERTAQQHSVAATFSRALGLCLLTTVGMALLCSVFPVIPMTLLFGRSHDPSIYGLVRMAAWAFVPVPMLNLLVQFLMARHTFRFLPALVVLCAVYLVMLALAGQTPTRIMLLVAAVATSATVLLGFHSLAELTAAPARKVEA